MLVDRLAPALRPVRPLAGYHRWRSLLFLHWPVSPQAVRRVVPPQLELDDFHGEYFVGVVPFAMEGVRAKWWPEALALAFLETNVRTYVRYRGRPGVYFLSLDAQSRLAVAGARMGWSLPYYYAQMELKQNSNRFEYRLRRSSPDASLHAVYETGELLGPSEPESLEHFFLERYLLFVERRGCIFAGRVHHVPYPAQTAIVHELAESLVAAAGLPPTCGLPAYAHYAAGVDVEIFALERCN